jgi:hypothetical protein
MRRPLYVLDKIGVEGSSRALNENSQESNEECSRVRLASWWQPLRLLNEALLQQPTGRPRICKQGKRGNRQVSRDSGLVAEEAACTLFAACTSVSRYQEDLAELGGGSLPENAGAQSSFVKQANTLLYRLVPHRAQYSLPCLCDVTCWAATWLATVSNARGSGTRLYSSA